MEVKVRQQNLHLRNKSTKLVINLTALRSVQTQNTFRKFHRVIRSNDNHLNTAGHRQERKTTRLHSYRSVGEHTI